MTRRPEDWMSPDLSTKLALLEDRGKHLKDKLDLHAGATDARLAVLEHRLVQGDWHHHEHYRKLTHLEAEIMGLSSRQSSRDRLADNLRYAVAAGLILMTLAGRLAPDSMLRGIKLLGLLP